MAVNDWMVLGYMIFVTLNAIDMWITRALLSHPTGKEKNPIMRFLYRHFGLMGMGAIKILILGWLGIQCYIGVLDLFAIYYLNLVFIVVLYFMFKDAIDSGLRAKLFPWK